MQLFIQFKAKPALTEFGAAVFLPSPPPQEFRNLQDKIEAARQSPYQVCHFVNRNGKCGLIIRATNPAEPRISIPSLSVGMENKNYYFLKFTRLFFYISEKQDVLTR